MDIRKTIVMVGLLMMGCGVNPHASSDAARISTVQEIREDLKKDPRDRDIRYLNVTKGAKLVLDPDRPLDDPRLDGKPADPSEAAEYKKRREMIVAAREKAQEGALALYSGDTESGLSMLRQSMEMYPTLDALVPLVDHHKAEGDEAGIVELCTTTRPKIGDAERYELLRHCQLGEAGEPIADRLAWTSTDDQEWYEAERARQLELRDQEEE